MGSNPTASAKIKAPTYLNKSVQISGGLFAIGPHWRPSMPCRQILISDREFLPAVQCRRGSVSAAEADTDCAGNLDFWISSSLFILSAARLLAYCAYFWISLISSIFSVLLVREKRVPCRRCFAACQSLFNPPQYCFYQMKPQIAKYKYYHKKQQECSDLFPRHNLPHFVAKWFIKKSVNAASSSSCDT